MRPIDEDGACARWSSLHRRWPVRPRSRRLSAPMHRRRVQGGRIRRGRARADAPATVMPPSNVHRMTEAADLKPVPETPVRHSVAVDVPLTTSPSPEDCEKAQRVSASPNQSAPPERNRSSGSWRCLRWRRECRHCLRRRWSCLLSAGRASKMMPWATLPEMTTAEPPWSRSSGRASTDRREPSSTGSRSCEHVLDRHRAADIAGMSTPTELPP